MRINYPVYARRTASNSVAINDASGSVLCEICRDCEVLPEADLDLARFLVEIINNSDPNIDLSHVVIFEGE